MAKVPMSLLGGGAGDKAASGGLFGGMEEEIKVAQIESNLRQTCLDLCKPTILRMTLVHGEMQETKQQMQDLADFVKHIDESVQLVLARSEYIQVLKTGLEDTTSRLREADSRLSGNGKVFRERISVLETEMEAQKNWNDKIDRGFDRVSQDLDDMRANQKEFKETVNAGFAQCREQMSREVASMKTTLGELDKRVTDLNDDVWGPDKVEDVSPPSLRRLDMQMRKVQSRLVDALSDLAALRRLEGDIKDMGKEQGDIRDGQVGLEKDYKFLRERVEKISLDVKQDSEESANRMAAFTASLMRDVRGTFAVEVKSLQAMQNETRFFVSDTKKTVEDLDKAVIGVRSHVEAVLREMRIDIDGVDTRRKRDKQGVQDGVTTLQEQVRTSLQATESTLKGLEHVSKVVSMALQGERVSIALDVQDYVDRKDTPYVGVKPTLERPKTTNSGKASPRKDGEKPRKREGLEPKELMRISYQPTPVSFQGAEFDRAQLLALREKLIHTAQQVLQKGPDARSPKGAMAFEDDIPGPLVPAAMGAYGDGPLPSGRRSASLGSRPGSRAQPSARGSPIQEESWSTPTKEVQAVGTPDGAVGMPSFGPFSAREPQPARKLANDSPEGSAGGTHLPALTSSAGAADAAEKTRGALPDASKSRTLTTSR